MTDPRRALPAVDALLATREIADLLARHPRSVVVRAIRDALDDARQAGGRAPIDGWTGAVAARAAQLAAPSLAQVVNATGVVLHTNLGRAVLADRALDALGRVGGAYTTLEYDLEGGTRGSRTRLCRDVLVELTGAADALIVNNAAAALLLVLSAVARGGEAIVSRGELIEIGGQFRIPDILARSGAALVEVGTTNRTHTDDYRRALGPATRILLKVHRSNFRITGFTTEVSATELATLAHHEGRAALYDLGSGLLVDLTPWGLTGEPSVREALASGVDAVVFSGDKLLGGPQAGILLGTRAVVDACRADPLARALRADKFTLAALEATLVLYRDPATARREIPVLRMLTTDATALRERAEALAHALPPKAGARVTPGSSEVGGGAFAEAALPTWLVELVPDSPAPDELARRLRHADPPVVARIAADHVALDPRTILVTQEPALCRAVAEALDG